MLKQYQEIKARHKDAILFFRLGDFYEMFGDDALEASKILNITLTARGKGTPNEVPMCGVPHHSADSYLTKLTSAGKKVAICEQISDPKLPGIVQRSVVRIVTPGTTLDSSVLNNKQNNFIACVNFLGRLPANGSNGDQKRWGIAVADLTTGDFKVTQLTSGNQAVSELGKLKPAEVVVTPAFWKFDNPENGEQKVFEGLKNVYHFTSFNPPGWESAQEILQKHFKIYSLDSFGLEKWPAAVESAGLLLSYLLETQKTNLAHLKKISRYTPEEFVLLDESTLNNLEIFESLLGGEKGSLISVIDQTITAMGGRLLRQWLLHPLRDAKNINLRLAAVKELVKNGQARQELNSQLKNVLDIERLLAKLGCQRANARDLIGLKNSLEVIPQIRQSIQQVQSENFSKLRVELKDQTEVISLIKNAIEEEAPAVLNEGGIIKNGHNGQLDELRKITSTGKAWIKDLEKKEIQRTGINSLKVKFNQVFGYYIEVSKSNLAAVPQDYIRKQTLVNAERFVTPELKEYEEKVLGAEDKIKELEYQLFCQVRDQVAEQIAAMQSAARSLAEVDVYLALAQAALLNRYCQPSITEDGKIEITNGRHPVIEKFQAHSYVPNDVYLDNQNHRLIILTGPNMSGKSSYLRQVALTVLLAQIGSFVPAEKTSISLVDRIFTRVGASDNLIKGQSTFMVEMQEAANILNNATSQSLIILDELGRGTSTYDGVSIAWAIAEYIHNNVKAKTLFATHYHELIEMADELACSQNYCVAVKENPDGVVFLHRVLKGGIDKSYGIEVARIAGLPQEIVFRAKTILKKLEAKSAPDRGQEALPFAASKHEHPVVVQLKNLKVEEMTPLEALRKISEWKAELSH